MIDNTDYVLALASQGASLSSFLGGFSATVFVTLLTLAKSGLAARVAIGAAAFAAVSFLVSLIASVTIGFALHPEAPAGVADKPLAFVTAAMGVGFLAGITMLLAAIGISGWIRSRALGWFTSVVSTTGLVLCLALM